MTEQEALSQRAETEEQKKVSPREDAPKEAPKDAEAAEADADLAEGDEKAPAKAAPVPTLYVRNLNDKIKLQGKHSHPRLTR